MGDYRPVLQSLELPGSVNSPVTQATAAVAATGQTTSNMSSSQALATASLGIRPPPGNFTSTSASSSAVPMRDLGFQAMNVQVSPQVTYVLNGPVGVLSNGLHTQAVTPSSIVYGGVQGATVLGLHASMVMPHSFPGLAVMKAQRVGNAVAQPKIVPTPCSVELPSVGSKGHARGRCKPCAFFHIKGCDNGALCKFCHLCDPGEKKRRAKEKLANKRKPKLDTSKQRGNIFQRDLVKE